ncbi:MAG TPA: hypothetical protein PLZ08_02500 [Bacillota bacterium]|nr:hypothetical protein [Bacillota bacterium]HOL09944.1 hypothetical protein [Bacillota bacterium]HPO96810.1 hypothetical protein [Bacillota bacterium]
MKRIIVTLISLLIIILLVYIVDLQGRQAIRTTVSNYYDVVNVYKSLVKQVRKESTEITVEQLDQYFQDELIGKYQEIMTGNILNSFEEAIRSCSVMSEDYQILYSDLEAITIKSVEVKRLGLNNFLCTVLLNSKESYSSLTYHPVLETIVKDYKVSNLTQEEFDEFSNEDFIMDLDVNRKELFYLRKVKDRWLIYDIQQDILNSTLKIEK